MAAKKEIVTIKPIEEKTVELTLVGDSSLICNRWSHKAKMQLPSYPKDSTITKKKEYCTPIEAFVESMYWISHKPTEYTEEAFLAAIEAGAEFGFPVTAIKKAAISAAYRLEWVPNKMGLKGAFFIEPDFIDDEGTPLVKIHCDAPVMREDLVRIGMGSPDLRWRGEFRNWKAVIRVRYNQNAKYTLDDIVNVLAAGGYYCGIGEWRVEKDGQNGCFHVE